MERRPAKLKVILEIVRAVDPYPPCICVYRGNKGLTGEWLVSRGNKGLSGESGAEKIKARGGGG
jgi:hypothetical protein